MKPSDLVSRRKQHPCTELTGSRHGYLYNSVNQHRPTIALFVGLSNTTAKHETSEISNDTSLEDVNHHRERLSLLKHSHILQACT